MRQIVLDTETTGLDPESGHRIIEIGCIEIANRRISERRYHQYVNPERDIDAGALEVHGLTTEFLATKPKFAEIVEEFLEFVRDSELIIHNAPFDTAFLNLELKLWDETSGSIADRCRIFDTLLLARTLHPGQRNSLDALCRRYEVDNTHRELHGALLDAELLADVYLAMTGGQVDLQLAVGTSAGQTVIAASAGAAPAPARTGIPVVAPSAEEIAAHRANLEAIDEESGGQCLWLRQPG